VTPTLPASPLEGILRTFARAVPRCIVLVGSAARGAAAPDSDLDLLAALDDDAPPEVLKWQRIQEARRGYTEPVDIVLGRCCANVPGAKGSFADRVLRDGIVGYERQQ
jgi:predicted nucleotidyltransferase